MRRHAPLLALLLLLLISPIVTAQSNIDRGIVNVTGSYISFPLAQFKFEGPQSTTLNGALRVSLFHPQCGPCVGGEPTSFGSVISESSSFPGSMTTGTESREVFYEGFLTFSGPTVTLPIRFSRLPFTVITPITAQGVLRVYNHDPFDNSSDPIFVFPVKLQGKATVTFKLQSILPWGKPEYKVIGSTYEFPATAKTSEEPGVN